MADFNGDSHLDFARATYSDGHVRVYPGNGDGTFTNQGLIASLDPNNHASYDGYDLNADGHVDMVAVDYSSRRAWFYPGLGDGTFGARVLVGNTAASTLGISAAPYRMDAMLYWYWPRDYELTGSSMPRLADADGDGVPNVSEYAFQMNPTVPDATPLAPYDPGTITWPQFHGLPLWTVTSSGRLVVEYVHFQPDPTLDVFAAFNNDLAGGPWALPPSPPVLMGTADRMARFRMEYGEGDEGVDSTCFGSINVRWHGSDP